jgi:AcrR family transcriptional regulator
MATRPKDKPEQPPAAGRQRAAHLGPERRRPLVLDAALHLFVEHGYRGTSMEGIAAAAGVTKPVVYRCYPNKQELFRALLSREEQRLLESVAHAVPPELDPNDLEAVLEAGFTALFAAARSQPDSWRIVFVSEHGSEPAIARRVKRARTAVVERLTEMTEPMLVGMGVDDAPRKAPVVSEVVASIAEGGVRLLLSDGKDWTPEQLGEFLGRLVARGPAAA